MTETTDSVQELNEENLEKITGGLGWGKWWGSSRKTVQDHQQFVQARQESFTKHSNLATDAYKQGDTKTWLAESKAASNSREKEREAYREIAKLQAVK